MNKDKFQILRDFAKSNEKPDKTIYEYVKEVLDMNSAYAKENQELKKQLEELEFIVGLRQKRNLINKFNKEYDEEDKKKNPDRNHATIIPDAEEIYRRYYAMKTQQKEFIEWLEKNINHYKEIIKSDRENNTEQDCRRFETRWSTYEEALSKYKEIIGEEKCEK